MSAVVVLELASVDHGLRVRLDSGTTRAVEVELPRSALDDVHQAMARARAAVPRVLTLAAATDLDAADEHTATTLAGLLAADPAVIGMLGFHLGAAQHAAEPLVVAVDARTDDLRAPPWELLPGPEGLGLESTGRGLVVRRLGGVVHRFDRAVGARRIAVWAPQGNDRLVSERLQQLRALGSHHGVEVVEVDGTAPVPPCAVVHIICHGRAQADAVHLALSAVDAAPGSVAHALLPLLSETGPLVVLDVCEAALPHGPEGGLPVRAMLDGGARAVVAPRHRIHRKAAQALGAGLYGALLQGGSLADAICAGRREVRALHRAHPDGRWHNPGLYVTDPGVVGWCPWAAQGFAPALARRFSPAAREVLDRAWKLAEELQMGFVGLEHLLLSWADAPGLPPAARESLRSARPMLLEGVTRWRRPSHVSTDPVPTPRLRRRLQLGLPPHDLTELARMAAAAPHSLANLALGLGLDRLWEDPDPATGSEGTVAWTVGTTDAAPETRHTEPAGALEVVGGPEDGRRLALSVGDVVGRHSGQVSGPGTLCVDQAMDPSVSRQHLTWVGPGRVQTHASVRRVGAGRPAKLPKGSEVELAVGELLRLGRSTWLVGVVR